MIFAWIAAWAGTVALSVEGVGGPVTHSQSLMLQSTLQRTSDFYEDVLGIPTPATLPMHLTIYWKRDAYEEIRAAKRAPVWSDGFFRRVNNKPEAILWGGSPSGVRGLFLHEASHYLMSYAGRSPRWLNEGIAQVFETARVRGNVLTVTPTQRHLRILAQLGRPTVHQIVTHPGGWTDLPAEQVGPLYISAWALSAMLLSTPEGQKTTAEILRRHRRTATPSTAIQAVEDTYPGGLLGLQSAFDTWAERPPRTLMLTAPIRVKPAPADALWIRCKDGRLVSRSLGCKTP